MDAFEQLVSEILWTQGFWVQRSCKVELTKEEKVRIGRPSSPRWELDVLAFSGGENLLRVVECKSYLDSRGVQASAFDGSNPEFSKRFKLFNNDLLRDVVFARLRAQLADRGACPPDTEIRLCLACGRIPTERDREWLHRHFDRQGWELWDEAWLQENLSRMAAGGYENQVSSVVAKLIMRSRVDMSPAANTANG
jgi:hypothetical protein